MNEMRLSSEQIDQFNDDGFVVLREFIPAAMLAELREDTAGLPPTLHQTTWCADMAIDFINEERSDPWLMSVNMFDPHSPFDPPQEYLDRYDPALLPDPLWSDEDPVAHAKLGPLDGAATIERPRAKAVLAAYYAMIELIDDNVGRMLAALEESGQLAGQLAACEDQEVLQRVLAGVREGV